MADKTRSSTDGDKRTNELPPEHAEATPLVQASSSTPRRRLTTRDIVRRRRQRLLELLQRQGKPPASSA